jgi:hypothetical protein
MALTDEPTDKGVPHVLEYGRPAGSRGYVDYIRKVSSVFCLGLGAVTCAGAMVMIAGEYLGNLQFAMEVGVLVLVGGLMVISAGMELRREPRKRSGGGILRRRRQAVRGVDELTLHPPPPSAMFARLLGTACFVCGVSMVAVGLWNIISEVVSFRLPTVSTYSYAGLLGLIPCAIGYLALLAIKPGSNPAVPLTTMSLERDPTEATIDPVKAKPPKGPAVARILLFAVPGSILATPIVAASARNSFFDRIGLSDGGMFAIAGAMAIVLWILIGVLLLRWRGRRKPYLPVEPPVVIVPAPEDSSVLDYASKPIGRRRVPAPGLALGIFCLAFGVLIWTAGFVLLIEARRWQIALDAGAIIAFLTFGGLWSAGGIGLIRIALRKRDAQSRV